MTEKYVEKDMNGGLFPNKYKQAANHPDYTGTITVEGKQYKLAMWCPDEGKTRYSLKVSLPEPVSDSPSEGEEVSF